MENGERRPTAEEVIARLKDDGDFDSLRLKIVRKVKENVSLPNDSSFSLRLPSATDTTKYYFCRSKIMGQISDEVWKVIKSCENDIRGTVESVYDRIVKPEVNKQDSASPQRRLPVGDEKDQASLVAPSTCETNVSDGNEQMEVLPGFCSTDQPSSKVEHAVMLHDEQPHSSNEVLNDPEQIDAVPPGFGPPVNSSIIPVGVSDEDPDVPPGFG
ncbi:hypothetical protein BHM03_00040755 [Ensete ventricosum]|nr:hypothetical protein BHM03_00040755 [Ensete ventricosum]